MVKQRLRRLGKIDRIIAWLVILTSVLTAVMIGVSIFAAVTIYTHINQGLPKITVLADYQPPIITTVYADDGRKIAEFYKERRIVRPLSEIPLQLQQAFISAEDARFYMHPGVDLISIVRAFLKNIRAGTVVQGGSTITQQVTKSFLLTSERSYERKIKEAILAYRIEKRFTKKEILFLYLNQIYLGHGAYGVEAAAENYFGKTIGDLNLAECAMLAGLPQAPTRYSPFHYPDRARKRQVYVLNQMVDDGAITRDEANAAMNTRLDVKPRRNWYNEEAPVYTEHIRRYVEKKYGEDALYTQGLQIYAAVNVDMQKAATAQIQKGLRDLDRRRGYRGPEARLAPDEIEDFFKSRKKVPTDPTLPPDPSALSSDPPKGSFRGVVVGVDDDAGTATVRTGKLTGTIPFSDFRWTHKADHNRKFAKIPAKKISDVVSVGDVIRVRMDKKPQPGQKAVFSLDQIPDVQSALVCMEAETGQVKVMVGGRDFRESQFNRAVQSRRQPGSAFKPVIYAAAIEKKGYTPATEIIDSPIVFASSTRDSAWKPKNYGKRFYGPTLLREALAKSRNVVTIKILQDIGVSTGIAYAKDLGIHSPLERNYSIALGSSGVTPLELVNAYAIFANQGCRVEPTFITRIEDRFGNVLEAFQPSQEQAIDKSTAYIITSMMESVVREGTGALARKLGRPVAAKTGTTNDFQDAWFVGYTPQYVTGVWVGQDHNQTLGSGETGAKAAGPIWVGFMEEILKNVPVRDFTVPEDVVFVTIDAKTGLLPVPETTQTRVECFKEGTAPTQHTKRPGIIEDIESFFKSDL
ncbi:penicillin-binding protein 1A [Desulfosarcina sp. OttesenSCG-928-A07]|nr:penicillin-binding protein 1A [Desulfosarcina sp. OttesenSCG-928-A07]